VIERYQPRLLQGAKISLGSVTSLGRALTQLRPDEIAYIIGTYMTKSTETLPDGRRLHRGSIGRAMRSLWPGEDEPDIKVKREVTYHLRRNGFSAVGRGEMFQGWEVPRDLQDWRDPQERKPRDNGEEETRYVSPLTRSWICTICPDHPRFVSEEERDKHVTEDHVQPTLTDVEEREEAPMETVTVDETVEREPSEMKTCPVCGKKMRARGLPGHMNGHVITTHQADLLDLIRKHPGEPRDYYVEKLGQSRDSVSGYFSGLHARDLVHRTGKTRQVRWWPKSKLDHDDPKSHVCVTCGQAFPSSRTLSIHRTKEHENGAVAETTEATEYPCPYCGQVFPNPRAIGGHVAGKINGGDEAHMKGGEGVAQRRSTGRSKATAARRTRRRATSNGSAQGVKGTDIRQVTMLGEDLLVLDGKLFRIAEIDLQGLGVQG
jgi:DNA-directed RNA polymerase subunit RPC12/RpoP